MGQFVVSARKYRPLKFNEVVGQSHVTDTLKNALMSDHLAHAFLFCGPRGVGKTTCARILAKAINCQNPTEDFEPCNACGSCKAFNENASFNIIELDAASNNSVDHIRSLVEQVRFQPQQGKYKVFIIDEVHMLSSSAFNAFLKTLEEPPPYAIFILATTEKHKILPTILSRCQIYDFKRISVADMVKHLEHISHTEGLKAEKEALQIISAKADGALRDALSIFDRMASLGNDAITYQVVIDQLNILDYDYYFKIVDALLTEKVDEVLQIYDEILRNGFEGDQFLLGITAHIRDLLVCKHPKTIGLLEVSDHLKERYENQAKLSSISFLMSALDLLNQCDIHYARAINKRLHVEIALAKLTYVNRISDEAVRKPDSNEKKTEVKTAVTEQKTKKPASKPRAVRKSRISVKPIPKVKGEQGNAIKIPSVGTLSDMANKIVEKESARNKSAPTLNLENLESLWSKYYQGIESPAVKTYLKQVRFELTDDSVTIFTGSTLAQNAITQQTDLLQQIRKHFRKKALEINFDLDEALAGKTDEKRRKALTNKEIYEALKDENPLIENLIKTFDLRIDK